MTFQENLPIAVFKPPQKLGGLLSSFKDAIEPGYRQGAIYKINCSDCDKCYIGETKRWFETRKKEHIRDVKNGDNNATALSKHTVELGHSIDWKNYVILQIETDYHKRKFIELFYINSLSNALNDKNPFVFLLYTKICFRNITFQFSRSLTKRKNCCCAIANYFDSFCFIVSRDLVFLRCLFFHL